MRGCCWSAVGGDEVEGVCFVFVGGNGTVGYWNCPNTRPVRRAACIALGAQMARGQADPHRLSGVLERLSMTCMTW